MTNKLLSSLAIAVAGVDGLIAAPIDFTFGIASGVLYESAYYPSARHGLANITLPFDEYIANKTYTAQIVQSGSGEENEAFYAINGDRDYGFGSALTGEDGTMEVGVFNELRDRSLWIAASRAYGTIKNNTENEIDLDFYYEIEPGELAIHGIRSDNTARALVAATIDYLLLTPDEGTYEESRGNLLDYYVEIGFDSKLYHSDNATVALMQKDDFNLVYKTAQVTGKFRLPTIPAYGQLTYYYDLYSLLNTYPRFEIGGLARIGDPTDLKGGGRTKLELISADPSSVPEPSTVALTCFGLLAGVVANFRRRHSQADGGERQENGGETQQ